METAKTSITLLTLVLLMGGAAHPAQGQATENISGTRTASCLVKVTADPAVLPLDLDTIEDLLRSSGIGGKAAREVLGVPLVDNFLDVDPVSGLFDEPAGRPARLSGGRRLTPRQEMYDTEYMETTDEYQYNM